MAVLRIRVHVSMHMDVYAYRYRKAWNSQGLRRTCNWPSVGLLFVRQHLSSNSFSFLHFSLIFIWNSFTFTVHFQTFDHRDFWLKNDTTSASSCTKFINTILAQYLQVSLFIIADWFPNLSLSRMGIWQLCKNVVIARLESTAWKIPRKYLNACCDCSNSCAFVLDPNSMARTNYREFLLEIRVCKEQASLNTIDHENYFARKYLPFNKNRKETRAKIGRTLSSSIAIDSQNREILNHAQNPLKTEQRSSFFPIEREKRSRTADWFGIQGNGDKSDAKTKRGNVGGRESWLIYYEAVPVYRNAPRLTMT